MKIYAIATICNETYGHGDVGQELKICQEDAYHTEGKWNPVFEMKEDAEKFLKKMQFKYKRVVVEIELKLRET